MTIPETSSRAIAGLQPKNLWNYFLEISSIPRESENEEGVRNYLIEFATKNKLVHHTDKTGNVIIKAPASEGMEHIPPLALQGHMDMVCVKKEGVIHDFAKDPIILKRDGDWLKAEGTSLGGDNGVAIALILDLFSDPEAKHGPLEAIFTVAEETGLEGAFGLDPSYIQSRKMINLDSEKEGVFYIGCAGGIEVNGAISIEKESVPSSEATWNITLDGLFGGHSGGDIHIQRANAISSMARFLRIASDSFPIRIVSIDGGTKRNVIPSVCKATITLPRDAKEQLYNIGEKVLLDLKKEYEQTDAKVQLTIEPVAVTPKQAASRKQSLALINALFLAPHGVERMSHTIPEMVETSSNMAIIRTTDSAFTLITSHRSSVQSSRDLIARKAMVAFETAGAQVSLEGPYPAWTPNPESPLARLCATAWESFMGKKAKITAIHAGLECGIINSLIEGMDSVSLGPNLRDVHSVKERLSISSTAKIAQFLRHLCPIIT